uniref:C2H2-type domain-containing protein n=1 Tax=Mesocestoides corti TaxID=53468 RepID=A0A5K3EXI5_MESCO
MTQLSTSSCSTTNGASGAATLAQQLVAAKASSDRSSPWLPNNGGGGCGSGRTSPVISDHLKAVLMALPLEEPRVVACTVCPRRFKNQSALNGHMRLHGGYGLNNVGSTSSSSSVSSGKRSQPSQQPPSPPLGPLPSSSSRAAATKPKKHLSSTHDRPMGDIILRDLSEGNQLPRPEDPSVFDWSATPTTATTTMTTPASEADTSQSQRRTPSPQPHCSSTKANLHSLRNLGLTSPGVEAPSPMNTSLVNSQWSARHAPGLLQQQQQSSFNPALTKERFPGVPMFPSTQSPFSLPEVTSITESSSGSYPPTAPSRLSSSLPRLHSDLQCVGDCSATCRQEENASHFAPNPPPPLPAYPALRKRAPFGQQQQQQQFRAAPGLAWFQPQHPQIGDRVESDLLFSSVASNLRLMETQPIGTTAFRDQGRYISRLTPAPSSPSSSSSSSRLFHSAYPSQQRLPGSKFDPLAAFCAAAAVAVSGDPVFSQAGFFPGYSTAETSGPQPHYSPITPASSGFSSSTSAPAFTFPPSEALLSTTSPPLPPPPPVSQKNKEFYTQSMQFVCPPRSSPFGEPASQPSKWVPPPPPSVEPFMSSSPSITPAAQFSPHRQRSHQHSQVYQVHGRTPLYPSADQQDVKQETPTAFPSPVAPHFAQQTPVYDQQRHPVGSGPRSVCCGNISADGSVMRHPMTPQHHAYAGHPRAYSYTSTTTHAAYSVPIMSSQERVFFPDDLDPLLALESDEDYGRPTTPKVDTVPPLHQQQQQRHQQQPYEQIQLSSVPSHKYQSTAQLAQPVSVLLSDEPSVFRNPQAPPPSVKKQKRKPAPIIIPSSAHRLNASRLRSPRLWTVSSVGGPTANASVKNDLLSGLLEPPPYTPPPMLSPNRRGSGLFSSIARNRRTLAICSAAAAVGTFRPRNTPVPIRRASPAPPKSAPAFVKNASYFSQDINPKTLINDQAGGGIDGNSDRLNGLGAATRAIMRTVEDIGGKDQAKPKSLFFGEDEDDLDGLVVVSRRRDTPDTEEAKSNSPGGASTGTSRSFSSCCCSPVRHTVDVDVEEEDEDDIVEDIGVPSNFEPKINIGPAYQVEVPEFVEGQHSTFLFGPLSMLVSECLYFIF